MLILLITAWFIWEIKYVLFWLYLWQLKDYHLARFADHFRTHKGQKIFFNFIQFSKLALLILSFLTERLFNYLFAILFIIYIAQAILFLESLRRKSLKAPQKSLKIMFLTAVSFLIVILFLLQIYKFQDSSQLSLLLGFDILTPLIISLIVLLFQPVSVLLRNIILIKAENRIKKIRSASGLKVIAITGSYGKTSTKEFLSTILSKKYKVLKTKEHQNSEIGVAKCILHDLNTNHQVFIAEVGAYDKGKVREVCSILKPQIGIVTGVNEQHLGLFGSFENLLSAEGGRELADALPEDGILVVNGDNKYCLDLYKRRPKGYPKNKKVYSLTNKIIDSDIWSDGITVYKDKISFLAIDKTREIAPFNVKVLGAQNVQNLLGAILTAKQLGMNFGEISEACEGILQEQGGMILKQGKHGIDIIDSSYSSNPDGVFADLDYLSIFSGKKVIAMPCLIELGEKSAEIHRKIGRKIGEICDLAIITTKDKFKEIKEGFLEAQYSDILRRSDKNVAKCLLCDNSQDIYSLITLVCKAGDVVLLEGRVPNKLIGLLEV